MDEILLVCHGRSVATACGSRNMWAMALIDIRGVQLEVVKVGPSAVHPGSTQICRGPIVFLHEGLGSVAMWRDWPADVCNATGRAGWVYSRQGYGQSSPTTSKLPPDYLHHEAWDVLPALLAHLGVQRPVLLGHSDGASIALLYASRFPVAACIVLAPHVMVEDVSIQSINQARDAFGDPNSGLRQRLARYHTDVDGAFQQWNDAWLNPAFRAFDIRPDCRRISAPVLAIQGVDDPYGTMAQIDQISLPAERIQRLALPACGHSPHRDQTQLTTQAITSFLASVD